MINIDAKNIFQIYLTDDDSLPIPTELMNCISSVNSFRGDNDHYLIRGEQLRDLLRDNFNEEVVWAYDKLIPYSFRADLGKFCLIYLFGGWYFDISIKPAMTIFSEIKEDFLVFKDAPLAGHSTWGVAAAVYYAKKGENFLLKCIEQIVDNCKQDYYGNDCLDVTGPGLFGKSICTNGKIEHGAIGVFTPLTPMFSFKNFAFILPSGQIFAWGKSTAGTTNQFSLDSLGSIGTNSYSHLWNQRKIYKTS